MLKTTKHLLEPSYRKNEMNFRASPAVGEHRRAWPEGAPWGLGGGEIERVRRPLGSAKWPSELGCGNIVLGLGNVVEDGQEGTPWEAERQVGVAAFCL